MIAMISVDSVISSLMQIAESVCYCRRSFRIFKISLQSPETCWPTVVLMARVCFQPIQRSTNVFVKGVAAKSETLQNYPVLSTAKNRCEGVLNSHHDQHQQTGTSAVE